MDRESFLREYNIDEATFESARISWEELEKIYRNYQAIEPKLRSIGKEFVDRYFYDVEKAGIHSYRYRAKDQGHLLEKIIRKRNENFEKPKVYRRTGDTRIYDDTLIDIRSDGIYRSLHYIIKYRGYYVEIQARTLFEEGWSEVDHDIVYPYFKDDVMLKDFSTLLNRLSGMADEMSSYFRRMKEGREEEKR